MENVLGVREEAMLRQQRTEFSNLVEEEIGVPVLAVELVPLDVGKNTVSQLDHLVVGGALFFGFQQLAIIGDGLLPLGHEPLGLPLKPLALLRIFDVAG